MGELQKLLLLGLSWPVRSFVTRLCANVTTPEPVRLPFLSY